MATVVSIDEKNAEILYPFRFVASNKVINLTQQQLDRIPYLSTLVARKDDFLSAQNENGEYVLGSQIRFSWFKVILNAIVTEKPSTLFSELSEKANVLDMLQLYDYLCIDALPVPLLKDIHIARTNPVDTKDENKCVEYRPANVLEARDTAAQFIIAINNNEYNLNDKITLQVIFDQVMAILSNPNVFTKRLCHHVLTVVKQCCFPLFSHRQRCYLNNAHQNAQKQTNNSATFLCNNDQFLPENFDNVFAWKGVYKPRDVSATNRPKYFTLVVLGRTCSGKSSLINMLCGRELPNDDNPRNFDPFTVTTPRSQVSQFISDDSLTIIDTPGLLGYTVNGRVPFSVENRSNEELYIGEAKSARSERFNTLPKRPKIDKYKHRCGPKAQKYR